MSRMQRDCSFAKRFYEGTEKCLKSVMESKGFSSEVMENKVKWAENDRNEALLRYESMKRKVARSSHHLMRKTLREFRTLRHEFL